MFKILKKLIVDYKETVGNCNWCKWNGKKCDTMPNNWCNYKRKWYLLWRS